MALHDMLLVEELIVSTATVLLSQHLLRDVLRVAGVIEGHRT